MGNKRKRPQKEHGSDGVKKKRQNLHELPQGIHHYERAGDLPSELQNYFRQRHRIWSKYNDGICMTENAWYGVSQEPVATKIAQHIAAMTPENKSIIMDTFCGVGGNTIAFALSGRWKRVYAIEKDAATLECARHNAAIYGVRDRITWFLGDCFELLGTGKDAVAGLRELLCQYGVIFGSPPWGGPGYKSDTVFNLHTMQPYPLDFIFSEFSSFNNHIVLYLPRTSDLRQIAECAEQGKRRQAIHYCTQTSSRALCAYLGEFRKLPAGP